MMSSRQGPLLKRTKKLQPPTRCLNLLISVHLAKQLEGSECPEFLQTHPEKLPGESFLTDFSDAGPIGVL